MLCSPKPRRLQKTRDESNRIEVRTKAKPWVRFPRRGQILYDRTMFLPCFAGIDSVCQCKSEDEFTPFTCSTRECRVIGFGHGIGSGFGHLLIRPTSNISTNKCRSGRKDSERIVFGSLTISLARRLTFRDPNTRLELKGRTGGGVMDGGSGVVSWHRGSRERRDPWKEVGLPPIL